MTSAKIEARQILNRKWSLNHVWQSHWCTVNLYKGNASSEMNAWQVDALFQVGTKQWWRWRSEQQPFTSVCKGKKKVVDELIKADWWLMSNSRNKTQQHRHSNWVSTHNSDGHITVEKTSCSVGSKTIVPRSSAASSTSRSWTICSKNSMQHGLTGTVLKTRYNRSTGNQETEMPKARAEQSEQRSWPQFWEGKGCSCWPSWGPMNSDTCLLGEISVGEDESILKSENSNNCPILRV